MIVADILMWFLLVAGTYIVFISYWLASQGLFPEFVDRCRQRIKTAPFQQFLFGLVLTIPIAAAGIALLNAPNPALKFPGAALLLILILAGLVGSTGLTAQIGAGLASPHDQTQAWRRVLRGGMVLGLTFILPLIGWFLILPGALIMGFGAALRSLRRTRTQLAPAVLERSYAVTER
jgi:hypothetical protein